MAISLYKTPRCASPGAGEVTTFCYALINKISSALFCLLSLLFLLSLALQSSTNFILFIFASNRTSTAAQLHF